MTGSGAPADAVGVDGDFYIDTVTGIFYGPKTDPVLRVVGDPPIFRAVSNTTYASRASTIINKPAGVVDGDIMLAVVLGGSATPASIDVTAPVGWAQIGTATTVQQSGGGFSGKLYVYWKRAVSEGADYTFTQANTIDAGSECRLFRLLASGDPVDVSVRHPAPARQPGWRRRKRHHDGRQHETGLSPANWDGTGLAAPAGMTERFDATTYAADQDIVTAGPTGTRTQTLASSGPWQAYLVALKPGSVGGSAVWPEAVDLATQAELVAGLATKAPLDSRPSRAIPKAPTPATADNDTASRPRPT